MLRIFHNSKQTGTHVKYLLIKTQRNLFKNNFFAEHISFSFIKDERQSTYYHNGSVPYFYIRH